MATMSQQKSRGTKMTDELKELDGQEPAEETGIVLDGGEQTGEEQTAESHEEHDSNDDHEEQAANESGEEGKINQEAVNKRINKAIREKKEAEEKAVEEKRLRKEAEEKLEAATKTELPDIPALPDIMDADYELKMSQRDDIIKQHAVAQANKDHLAKLKADRQLEEQKADIENVKTMVAGFDKKTTEFKLDKTELVEAQNTVGSFLTGKTELARYLLSDDNGPLLVNYLAQNIEELEKISTMPQTTAAVYIATKISPQAMELKPKTTKADAPPYTPPSGKGKMDSENPVLAGCTFE